MQDDDDAIVPAERLPDEGITILNPQRQILEAKGLFPRRVWITERRHGYVKRELRDYRRQKIAERDAAIAAERDSATS